MEDPAERVKNLISTFDTKHSIKKRSRYFKMLKNLLLDALEEHPDLNSQTLKQFAQSMEVENISEHPEKLCRLQLLRGNQTEEKGQA